MPSETNCGDEDIAVRVLVHALVVSLIWVSGVAAVELTDLFDGQVIVADQTDAAREQGQGEALAQVLVKVSGSTSVLDNPVIKEQLAKAGEFVVQFSYASNDEGELLALRFDRQRIERLLRQANEPQWGARRPLILLWWVDETATGRQVMSESVAADSWQALSRAGVRRGLPLMLPLMDLDDSMAVTPSDLWGQFVGPVLTASQRYRPDLVVLAKSYVSGTSRRLEWQLYPAAAAPTALPDASGNLNYSGTTPVALVDTLAEKLAAIYAVRAVATGQNEVMQVTISNLNEVADVVAAQRQLASLSAVSRVEVAALRGKEVEFRLFLLGTADDVVRALGLDRHFTSSDETSESTPPADGAADSPAPTASDDASQPQSTDSAKPETADNGGEGIQLVAPGTDEPAVDGTVAEPASAAGSEAAPAANNSYHWQWVR